MVKVDESVKQAYRCLNTYKEFLIDVSDVNFDDITNEKIVMDSVRLTESICSQDNLRFGLCEASVFECNAYDIPNLKGKEIYVSQNIFVEDYPVSVTIKNQEALTFSIDDDDVNIYIDTDAKYNYTESYNIKFGIRFSDLDVSEGKEYYVYADEWSNRKKIEIGSDGEPVFELYEIEANRIDRVAIYGTGSGTISEILVFGSLISIPYGKFTVKSCKKEAVSNTRSIVAYSQTAEGYLKKNEFEAIKQYYSTTKKISVKTLLCTSIKRKYLKFDSYDYDEGHAKTRIEFSNLSTFTTKTFAQGNDTLKVVYRVATSIVPSDWAAGDLCYFATSMYSDALRILEEIPKECDSLRNYAASICAIITKSKKEYFVPVQRIVYAPDEEDLSTETILYDSWHDSSINVEYALPYEWEYTHDGYTTYIATSRDDSLYLYPVKKMYGFDITDRELNMDLNSIDDIKSTIESIIEIYGKFGRISRNGYFELLSIEGNAWYADSDIFPGTELFPSVWGEHIHRNDYIGGSLWYEDYSVKAFGKITAACVTATGEEKEIEYIGDAGCENIYYMGDNEVLKSGTFTENEIESILAEMFESIKGIVYTPIEMEMRGLPFLEAGDKLFINAGDEWIKSIIFKRTLSGEQALTDEIESSGDEINNIDSQLEAAE